MFNEFDCVAVHLDCGDAIKKIFVTCVSHNNENHSAFSQSLARYTDIEAKNRVLKFLEA